MNIREKFGIASTVSSTAFTAGMECEIEDICQIPDWVSSCGHWSITKDGSLRNNGREIISKPLPKAVLMEQFAKLHGSIEYQTNDLDSRFSKRTSTHVHVNCLDLEMEQVKSIVMWYALYESIFFKLIDPYRENNIHCVKLDQTALSQKYKRSLEYLVGSWSKYTALNILPLGKYGTIEFRHLQGTDDTVLVKEWLNTLENLWIWGQGNTLHKDLLTPEWLAKSFHAIFKDSPRALALEPQLEQLISNSLIDIKLSLI